MPRPKKKKKKLVQLMFNVMWEGILFGQHVRKKKKSITQTLLLLFLKGFMSQAAVLCHNLQVEKG